ncbi:MAG: tRNA 2-selenouridine(34) synthase MnmH [Acidaminobacteraceae bacterium]
MIVDYKDLDDEYIFIDVRTPDEYYDGTIGTAYNIPLFSNEERADVGTAYKKESVEKAKKMAIEAVAKKLPDIYDRATWVLKCHKKVALFCARGGMRSQTIGSLLNAMGFDVKVINGGYKGYRNTVIEETNELAENMKFIVLHGNTGVGKTHILTRLKSMGIPIMDIEGLAKHRGSLLGKVGIKEIVTQKNFEHEIYMNLKLNTKGYVLVEAESRRLGTVLVPESVMQSMAAGEHVLVSADIEFRADIIVAEYIQSEENFDQILGLIHMFKKQIGDAGVKALKALMDEKEYREVAKRLMLDYYDPQYMHKAKDYDYALTVDVKDIKEASDEIKEFVEKNY